MSPPPCFVGGEGGGLGTHDSSIFYSDPETRPQFTPSFPLFRLRKSTLMDSTREKQIMPRRKARANPFGQMRSDPGVCWSGVAVFAAGVCPSEGEGEGDFSYLGKSERDDRLGDLGY